MTARVVVPVGPDTFTQALTTLRKLHGYSVDRVAKVIGVSVKTVYDWEAGRHPMSLLGAIKYAQAVHCRLAISPSDPSRFEAFAHYLLEDHEQVPLQARRLLNP